jgi:hypothetical protein
VEAVESRPISPDGLYNILNCDRRKDIFQKVAIISAKGSFSPKTKPGNDGLCAVRPHELPESPSFLRGLAGSSGRAGDRGVLNRKWVLALSGRQSCFVGKLRAAYTFYVRKQCPSLFAQQEGSSR